jgi:hypothetical protein
MVPNTRICAVMGMKVLYYGELSDNLRQLAILGKCYGVDAECVNIRSFDSLVSALMQSQGGILLDVASFGRQHDQDQLEYLAAKFARRDLAVLLVATNANSSSNLFLQTLSAGAVRGVKPRIGIDRVCFPATSSRLTGELASHSYRRTRGDGLGLVIDHRADVDVLMNLNDTPSFVRTRIGKASLFVWCTNKVFDLQRPLAAEREFEEAVDEYVPAIIFLRAAFRDQCWHNPVAGAGIVIDDPLLKARYGFINFRKLLGSARKHGYHITLAFIPWNSWRSRVKEVQMFLKYSDCFNVCVHGCDHTDNEFGTNNYEELLSRNFVASRRMDWLRARTGLASEALMVCPQEQYSLEAMRAFADSRQFIGLVCTACMPRNLSFLSICGADLLLPAQDSFFGFPIFKRHYSGDTSVFAMALFLGKPAILVEHHEFFRSGAARAEEFAQHLAELRPGLKWESLIQTVTRTHQRRRLSGTKWEIRFFTDVFSFEHELDQPVLYRLVRRIPESTVIKGVIVDGKEVPFVREDGFLTFEACADGPRALSVQIKVASVMPTKAYSLGAKYQTSVALRRGLSEFRDNIVARNRFALSASRRLMRSLRQAVR